MDIKKLFPENKVSKKGLIEFLDKKGFYIVLVLCIAIVGVTAYFVLNNGSNPETNLQSENLIPEDTLNKATAKDMAEPSVQSSVSTTPGVPKKTDTQSKPEDNAKKAEPQKNEPQKTQSKQPEQKTVKSGSTGAKPVSAKKVSAVPAQKFIYPVLGDVSFVFAQNKLVYSKTLDDWRTHSGMDIAAGRGTSVKAVADGVVSEIKNDPRFGIMVIVDHKNGLKTVYANLASDDAVKVKQTVKQNDVLGSIGDTAVFESMEQSHLHFEVWKDNKPVDPATYLSKK